MDVKRWLTTTDHEDIGLMYLWTGLLFFVVGGVPALLIRLELWSPGTLLVGQDAFNTLFTMHGTTMIFLAAMPAIAGLGNYLIPHMVGREDMAFPRLNALSFWTTLAGAIVVWSPVFLHLIGLTGPAPRGGWMMYPPLSLVSATDGTIAWALGITLLGAGSTMGAMNFIVTAVNERQPGTSLRQLPFFVWTMLATSLLLIVIIPPLAVAGVFSLLEIQYGAPFFGSTAAGGDPLLYQHLFWFFGHPEVYVAIFPFIGAAAEIIPRFSDRKLLNKSHLVAALAVATFVSAAVWAHHMFTVELGTTVDAYFAMATASIGIPFAIIIYNLVFTMAGGTIRTDSPMLFSIAFLVMFIVSGLEGLMLASPVLDVDLHDTYFVVGHFHYTLFGGAIMGLFAALYYWFPHMYGRRYDETLAKWHFWTTLVFSGITFTAMDLVGKAGMPRHYQDYLPQVTGLNQIATAAGIALGLAQLVFVYNYVKSARSGPRAGSDPWGIEDQPAPEWHGEEALEEVAS